LNYHQATRTLYTKINIVLTLIFSVFALVLSIVNYTSNTNSDKENESHYNYKYSNIRERPVIRSKTSTIRQLNSKNYPFVSKTDH